MDAFRLVALLLSLASGTLFAVVGRTVQQRQVSAEGRSAQLGFTAWWYGLALVTFVGAAQNLPGVPLELRPTLALTFVLMAVLCVALTGLIHYLVFLYTNRRDLLPVIVAGYVLFYALFLAYIVQSEPIGIEHGRWGAEIQYANPIEGGPLFLAVVGLLLLPPIGAAAAYLSLYRLAEEPVLKRRILLVSFSIIVWFGSSLLGLAPGAEGSDWWRLTSRLISLAAAGTILYAYAGLKPSAPSGQTEPVAAPAESIYERGGPRRGASHLLRA